MPTMKRFRVTLEVTINDDETHEPECWSWNDLCKGNYTAIDEDYGEKAEFVSQKLIEEWEEDADDDDDDDDDGDECPYSIGDRIVVLASTSEIEDHCGVNAIDAARIAGHKGRVVDIDQGDDYDVKIELDNGETTWIHHEHLSMHVEVSEENHG